MAPTNKGKVPSWDNNTRASEVSASSGASCSGEDEARAAMPSCEVPSSGTLRGRSGNSSRGAGPRPQRLPRGAKREGGGKKSQAITDNRAPAAAAAGRPRRQQQLLLRKRRALYLRRAQERRLVASFRRKACFSLVQNHFPQQLQALKNSMQSMQEQQQQGHRHKRTTTMDTLLGVATAMLEESDDNDNDNTASCK